MATEFKPWYTSVTIWAAVVQTIISGLELVAEYLNKGDFSPTALVLLVAGVLIIVRRIWFTSTQLY